MLSAFVWGVKAFAAVLGFTVITVITIGIIAAAIQLFSGKEGTDE